MPECGATTASGSTCKCRVREGRCHLHRDGSGADCAVCLADLTGACKRLPCGHEFHRRCILAWKRAGHHTCPLCRVSFAPTPPEYRVTITVQPVGREPRVYNSNAIPEVLRNIVTPDTDLTEIFIDVNTLESLEAILTDFGIPNGPLV